MNNFARSAIVVVLLFFSWKGAKIDLNWPPADVAEVVSVQRPSEDALAWAAPVREIAKGMLPTDRIYLASLYEAIAFILKRDFTRDDPVIKTTDDFVAFHSASLRLGIDKKSVGKYPGLAEAIDKTFLNAIGADQRALDPAIAGKLVAASEALSYILGIGKDE